MTKNVLFFVADKANLERFEDWNKRYLQPDRIGLAGYVGSQSVLHQFVNATWDLLVIDSFFKENEYQTLTDLAKKNRAPIAVLKKSGDIESPAIGLELPYPYDLNEWLSVMEQALTYNVLNP